jgi:hypothetical protein
MPHSVSAVSHDSESVLGICGKGGRRRAGFAVDAFKLMSPPTESQLTTELFDEDRERGMAGLPRPEVGDEPRDKGASCTRSQMSPSFHWMRQPSSRP